MEELRLALGHVGLRGALDAMATRFIGFHGAFNALIDMREKYAPHRDAIPEPPTEPAAPEAARAMWKLATGHKFEPHTPPEMQAVALIVTALDAHTGAKFKAVRRAMATYAKGSGSRHEALTILDRHVKGEAEPGAHVCNVNCPRCGATIEVVTGDDEPGTFAAYATDHIKGDG